MAFPFVTCLALGRQLQDNLRGGQAEVTVWVVDMHSDNGRLREQGHTKRAAWLMQSEAPAS